MNRFTTILISILILVSVLACGVMPLPRSGSFDYHRILTPIAYTTPAPIHTPVVIEATGDKAREWKP